MSTNELIEKQIKDVAAKIERADYYIAKFGDLRDAERCCTQLNDACASLLQIVQNQQGQIEKLRSEFDHATDVLQDRLERRTR